MDSNITNLSAKDFRRAADIKDEIESLERELNRLIDGGTAAKAAPSKRRGMSAAGRARVAAVQRARWAKAKGHGNGKPAAKRKRRMSASAKARLSEMAKARWAKVKASGERSL